MTDFRFLHAADLHLDSPLLGLKGRSGEFAGRVEQASRTAFERLVTMAIDRRCRFVVLAGDVFDGDLRDYASGLFFLSGMARLQRAGIRVVLIAGNHDAENRFFAKLAFADNVTFFGHQAAEHTLIEDVGVVVHGRSFGRREVIDNIALGYGVPHRNLFNVGVLHTACAGSEGHHAAYAPCTLEQLVNHGYDYWALGHVHTRAVLNLHPHVVYPGNLQGRSPKETGAKGATIVEVADGAVVACTHHDLDEVRWSAAEVDVSGATDSTAVVAELRERLAEIAGEAGGRPVALRLSIIGTSDLHGELVLGRDELRRDVEALIETMEDEIWLERFDVRTKAPERGQGPDPTISGRLAAEIRRLSGETGTRELMERGLADLRVKLPAGAGADELFARIRAEAPGRALELALSMVGRHAHR